MGLGPLPDVSLAEAREKAAYCRKLKRDGTDPIEARKADRSRAQLRAAKAFTFKDAAEAYVDTHKAGWRNEKHIAQWSSTLNRYAASGDRCNTGIKSICRGLEPQGLTWPFVEPASDLI